MGNLDDFDLVTEAGKVAREALLGAIEWAAGYRVARAVRFPDLIPGALFGWSAQILGTDREFGLRREFLPRTRAIRYGASERGDVLDFTHVRQGDVLQVRSTDSRVIREVYFRVRAVDSLGIQMDVLTDEEVDDLWHR